MIDAVDWRSAPLEPGTRLLVEASAGTGKTWTIAALYLRLVLERRLSPRAIVVATFTNKAADELRERLRQRLRGARELAASDESPDAANGPDQAWLAERWTDDARRGEDRRRLEVALGDFDLAPIGTLHRLADRILREQPFATGAGLRSGGQGDGAELRQELAGDLRRILLQEATHELSRLAAAMGGAPGAKDLGDALPSLLAPGVAVADDDPAADALLQDPELPARIRRVLGRRQDLFNAAAVAARALEALEPVLAGAATLGQIDLDDTISGLGKFATRTGLKKAAAGDPDLEWFQHHAAQLAAAVREIGAHRPPRAFWRAVGAWARAEARRRLEARDQGSFDALLETVHDALAAEDGHESRPLADALHALWPAALVDEFQDTDPVQYGILDRIWRCAEGRPRGWLAIVGDPKQAIYRFRGGDIETYRRARDEATARLALTTNHRSSAHFVAACNAFFGAGGGLLSARPEADIRYEPVNAARASGDASGLRIDGTEPEQPLRIRRIAAPADGLKADALAERAIEAVADEIAGMLGSGRWTIDGKPLEPAHIAVLVPGNDHVARTLAALDERRVPAVGSRQASVFESDTARDLILILEALIDPSEPVQRAALATALLGLGWETVRRMVADPTAAAAGQARLEHWRDTWHRLGVGAAVRALAADIAPRALGSTGGERVLTDLRHLGELLELASADHHGPHALMAWLKRERQVGGGSEADADARRVRLESDARRVQVMTVHAAKGLEFGIVFLPLAFRHGLNDQWRQHPLVRVPDPHTKLGRLDLPEAVKAHAEQLESDERFRLFYVAVTRAVHACVIYDAPAPQKMTHVPLSTLIARHRGPPHAADVAAADAMPTAKPAAKRRAATSGSFVITDPEADRAARASAAPAAAPEADAAVEAGPGASAGPSIAGVEWLAGLPPAACLEARDEEPAARSARPMPGPAAGPRPGRHSFSTLGDDAPRAVVETVAVEAAAEDEAIADADRSIEDVPDVDFAPAGALDASVEAAHPELAALDGARGTGFGNAVHAIIERRVHGQPIASQLDLVRRALAEHGAGDRTVATGIETRVAAMLDRVLDVPLWPGGPSAGQLAPCDQRAEFDFLLPLPRLRMAALRRIAADHGEPDLVPASDREVAGLLRGKVDLVLRHEGRYRALDWKSNRLGLRVDDYLGASLDRAMDGGRYRFQALLYTLALERHLRARLPGYERARHLGDPVYVFVRGAGLAPGAGLWSKPFAPSLLDAVDALFDGRGAEETAA
jgi:exodeoxyribonuclease V beta subunit